jgi:hypothetical protein
VREDTAAPADANDTDRASRREASTVIPGSTRGDPRAPVPPLGTPAAPRLTAEEIAGSIELEDIDEATAQRLIAAAIRRLHRDTPDARAGSAALAGPQPADTSIADGSALAWEVVQSAPAPGNTSMKSPSAASGFRVAGEAPPAFRAEVPSGWIYLIDGVPVFVPHPSD